MKKIILLLFVIAGCSGEDPTSKQTKFEVDPLFATQVDTFYAEALSHGVTVPETDNLIISVLAAGYQDENGVYANSRSYKKNGQQYIEISDIDPCEEIPLFRELAHVLLGKPYASDGDVIMNPYVNPCVYVHEPSGEVYPDIRETYLVKLFE